MRWPSRVPGLMRTSSDSVRLTTPSPWQTGQVEMFYAGDFLPSARVSLSQDDCLTKSPADCWLNGQRFATRTHLFIANKIPGKSPFHRRFTNVDLYPAKEATRHEVRVALRTDLSTRL